MIEEIEDVVRFCIEEGVTIHQFMLLYLIARKDFDKSDSLLIRYCNKFGKFRPDDIASMVKRGWMEDFNSPGDSMPEMLIVKDEFIERFIATEDQAEELWKGWPATFPLSTGGEFIARGGGDKDKLLEIYRKKIKSSARKHAFVMKQKDKYVQMVRSGRVNGRKLSDWIMEEMWDTVDELEKKEGIFGQDI